MVEAITKQECSRYGDFNGDCEFCLDAMECEQIAFRSRESKRKPNDDWLDGKGVDKVNERQMLKVR